MLKRGNAFLDDVSCTYLCLCCGS